LALICDHVQTRPADDFRDEMSGSSGNGGRGGAEGAGLAPDEDQPGRRYMTRAAKRKLASQKEAEKKRLEFDFDDSTASSADEKSPAEFNFPGDSQVQRRKRQQRARLQRALEETAGLGWHFNKNEAEAVRMSLLDLNEDVLELIVVHLDTASALKLFVTCKTIHNRLAASCGFWYQLCLKENFNEYHALKQNDDEEEEEEDSSSSSCETADCAEGQADKSAVFNKKGGKHVVKRRRRRTRHWVMEPVTSSSSSVTSSSLAKYRTSFTGEKLHCVKMPSARNYRNSGLPEDLVTATTYWRRVYLRGLQMRRNVCQGRFEMWRLFLTGPDHLPVKKMSDQTTFRELRSSHRNSPYNNRNRQVRILRYWTEEYMIVIQYRQNIFQHPLLADRHRGRGGAVGDGINDIFVWEWNECQNPEFKYVHSMYEMYPEGLSPMQFFLWKKYLVLMPNAGTGNGGLNGHGGTDLLRALVRVHDLSDNMALVGRYDLPENSKKRRVCHDNNSNEESNHSDEASHLHKIGEHAVGLVRVPEFYVFVFSLPDCELIRQIRLSFPSVVERPLETDDLEQRFLARKNVMYFIFNDPNFNMRNPNNDDEDDDNEQQRERPQPILGRLVMLDFEDFMKAGPSKAEKSKAKILIRLDDRFDDGTDYVEKISLIGSHRMACLLYTGKLVFKDILVTSDVTCTTTKRREIACPGALMTSSADDRWIDQQTSDEPTMVSARDGEQILVLRHFDDGIRRMHAYETSTGNQIFTIKLDSHYGLTSKPNYLAIDMDGNFVCAADLDKVVIWNSKTGDYVRTIRIPEHYTAAARAGASDDDDNGGDLWSNGSYVWRGHTDFAFAEDGLVIVHSQRNFPVAADVLLFW